MFDQDILEIVEIVKATPDSENGDNIAAKPFAALVQEAAKRGVSAKRLDAVLRQFPQKGLAMLYTSHSNQILGITPTRMFAQLYL